MSEDDRNKRNEVFSAQRQNVDPAIQTVSAFDSLKAEFGLDIPVELAPLPSNGRIYPMSSPLHGADSVQIRAMTAREEDILTSKALLKNGTVITELIRSCLIDKTIDPTSLIAGDRNALMIAIRISGYGHEYDAEVTCSNDECEQKAARQFNLSELEINRLNISPIVEGENLFEFRLPYTQKIVQFRFLTGRDEQDITTTMEKQKKLALKTDNAVTMNLLHTMVSVDGITDRAKISQFVRMMPARDSMALRNYIRDSEPGIKMRQEVTCPACGHVETVAIPLGISFFWPGTTG